MPFVSRARQRLELPIVIASILMVVLAGSDLSIEPIALAGALCHRFCLPTKMNGGLLRVTIV